MLSIPGKWISDITTVCEITEYGLSWIEPKCIFFLTQFLVVLSLYLNVLNWNGINFVVIKIEIVDEISYMHKVSVFKKNTKSLNKLHCVFVWQNLPVVR